MQIFCIAKYSYLMQNGIEEAHTHMFKMNTSKCKGCGLCISCCPKEALSFSGEFNKLGYDVIAYDASKCVLCGMCYQTCPDCVFEISKEG